MPSGNRAPYREDGVLCLPEMGWSPWTAIPGRMTLSKSSCPSLVIGFRITMETHVWACL